MMRASDYVSVAYHRVFTRNFAGVFDHVKGDSPDVEALKRFIQDWSLSIWSMS